jgi:hypothetical protein
MGDMSKKEWASYCTLEKREDGVLLRNLNYSASLGLKRQSRKTFVDDV